MKITREFAAADRYLYDFGLCSYENGWAQVDTAQDASYFGIWANPTRRMIFSYCEGDTTLKEAASPDEFAAELREIDAWNRARGYGPTNIDPWFVEAMNGTFHGARRWIEVCTAANFLSRSGLVTHVVFHLHNCPAHAE